MGTPAMEGTEAPGGMGFAGSPGHPASRGGDGGHAGNGAPVTVRADIADVDLFVVCGVAVHSIVPTCLLSVAPRILPARNPTLDAELEKAKERWTTFSMRLPNNEDKLFCGPIAKELAAAYRADAESKRGSPGAHLTEGGSPIC